MSSPIAGSDNSSEAIQANTSTGDNGQIIRSNNLIAQGGGTLTNLDRNRVGGLVGNNLTIGRDGSLVINEGFGIEDFENLSSLFTGAIGEQSKSALDGTKAIADSIKSVVSDAFGQITALAADRQATDPNASPVPQLSKTFLWFSLGGLGILAWILIKRK